MQHEHTEHVAASPDAVYAAIADIQNLPRFVPQMTAVREGDGDHIEVDAREVDAPGGGDELSSPYVQGGDVDLHAWARDALALALPSQIVCRDECAGLCPICGTNLNDAGPGHGHEDAPDPRWAKLNELRFE